MAVIQENIRDLQKFLDEYGLEVADLSREHIRAMGEVAFHEDLGWRSRTSEAYLHELLVEAGIEKVRKRALGLPTRRTRSVAKYWCMGTHLYCEAAEIDECPVELEVARLYDRYDKIQIHHAASRLGLGADIKAKLGEVSAMCSQGRGELLNRRLDEALENFDPGAVIESCL